MLSIECSSLTIKVKCSSLAWAQTKPKTNVHTQIHKKNSKAWTQLDWLVKSSSNFILSSWAWDLTKVYYQAHLVWMNGSNSQYLVQYRFIFKLILSLLLSPYTSLAQFFFFFIKSYYSTACSWTNLFIFTWAHLIY